jgi:hypothetical protein
MAIGVELGQGSEGAHALNYTAFDRHKMVELGELM